MNKTNNYFEIIVGTFVLVCAIVFLAGSFKNSNVTTNSNNYTISAKFNNIDGIAPGSDVKISGVKIGSVKSQDLDPVDFQAKLYLSIDSKIKLPYDSSIKVSSEGLLGSKYLSISPGAEEEYLKDGEQIEFTQSSVNLEELLGKFIFTSDNKQSQENE
ncbi:MAG: outer membrane lipid asymmetry maintenance protein MlaD [Rickettsiales bacterium]|nr:outer membrane lipid asymmetry maintenance protein MlaD [Rickettsiales bacterium]